jgi:DNA topoisomerase-3
MDLIVAEKASVGQSIAHVLGVNEKKGGYMQNGEYYVTWCVGHLVGLAEPEHYNVQYKKWQLSHLPIIPEKWALEVLPGKEKQYAVLAALMKDKQVKNIICATDAGREGELIFRWAYEKAGCRKPVKRLWVSSMEDEAIRQGFNNLKDGSAYDSLFAAGQCRAMADWVVGLNLSRLFTIAYNSRLTVGRVQSPTLAMMVQRQLQINYFVKEPFYTPEINCGKFTAAGERHQKKAEADAIQNDCDGKTAAVKSVEKKQKNAAPPKLYDLTTLQREANRIYGYTAQQTLDFTQGLYEAKLATYPRTDSQYITGDMHGTAKAVAAIIPCTYPYMAAALAAETIDISRITDNAKVTDHHAIIPTMGIAKKDLETLPAGEQDILRLISARLICAVTSPHIYEAVEATIECHGHIFAAKGTTVIEDGWKAVQASFKASLKGRQDAGDDEIEPQETALPELAEGQIFENVAASVKKGTTAPPKAYTEDTLLSAMENTGAGETQDGAERKGLGTPATRAAIIENLVAKQYVERKKKSLIPTQLGINLVLVLPETLKSPALTAEWENDLTKIAKGEMSAGIYMDAIAEYTKGLVDSNKVPQPKHEALFHQHGNLKCIGTCPRCDGPIYEDEKKFFCGTPAACKKASDGYTFVMWKNDKYFAEKKVEFTAEIAAALLTDGRVDIKGLYSAKKKATYDAAVVLDDTGGQYVNYKLEFNNDKK